MSAIPPPSQSLPCRPGTPPRACDRPAPSAFRAFAAELFRVAAFNFRREPAACTSQSFRTSSGHRVGEENAWHSEYPATNSTLGGVSTVSPFALATALLIASLLGWSGSLDPSQARLLPGFQPSGSPLSTAGFGYGATLGFAPTGLSPASSAVSLAAPPRTYPLYRRLIILTRRGGSTAERMHLYYPPHCPRDRGHFSSLHNRHRCAYRMAVGEPSIGTVRHRIYRTA